MSTSGLNRKLLTNVTVVEGIRPCCYPKKLKKPAATDSCFRLDRLHRHGTASRRTLGSHIIHIQQRDGKLYGCRMQLDFNERSVYNSQ